MNPQNANLPDQHVYLCELLLYSLIMLALCANLHLNTISMLYHDCPQGIASLPHAPDLLADKPSISDTLLHLRHLMPELRHKLIV